MPPIEIAQARTSLAAAAARSAELIASLPDMDARLDHSDWTVGQAAAHLAIALRGFTDAATGNVGRWEPMIPASDRYDDLVGGLNQSTIAAEPARSPRAAAEVITEAATSFLAATADRGPADRIPTPWYGAGRSHSLLSGTCLLLGEQVLHGRDIARGVGQKWSISSGDARIVFEGIRAMMPIAVNPGTAGDLTATYRVHVGRQSSFLVRVDKGTATVDTSGSGGSRVDCHIAGTPIALVLVGYGRISQWQAIASGRLIAWGRKPWLGFRFVNLFFKP